VVVAQQGSQGNMMVGNNTEQYGRVDKDLLSMFSLNTRTYGACSNETKIVLM